MNTQVQSDLAFQRASIPHCTHACSATFTSLASLKEAPSFLLPRRMVKATGMRGTLLGLLAGLLEQLGSYIAASMWRVVVLTGLGSLQACSTGAVLGPLTAVEDARVKASSRLWSATCVR